MRSGCAGLIPTVMDNECRCLAGRPKKFPWSATNPRPVRRPVVPTRYRTRLTLAINLGRRLLKRQTTETRKSLIFRPLISLSGIAGRAFTVRLSVN